MMVAGFFRVLSSRTLLLLLLLATTMTLMQRASAISSDVNTTSALSSDVNGTNSDATTSDTDDCLAEFTACQADATCQSCSTAGSSSEAFDLCYTFYPTSTSSQGCYFQLEAVCCLVGLSGFDCLDNDEFVAHSTCHLASLGCTEEIACDGAGDDDSGAIATASLGHASVVIAFSCSLMVVLPLLWV